MDLEGTPLEARPFDEVSAKRSTHDWLVCRRRELFFEASCGARNLEECLAIFRRWVELGSTGETDEGVSGGRPARERGSE